MLTQGRGYAIFCARITCEYVLSHDEEISGGSRPAFFLFASTLVRAAFIMPAVHSHSLCNSTVIWWLRMIDHITMSSCPYNQKVIHAVRKRKPILSKIL